MKKDRMRFARVRSPEDHEIGVFRFFIRAGAAAGTKDRRQTDDARGVSRSITAIDVVAAHRDARKFLRDVIHFVGRFGTAEHSERFHGIARASVCQQRRRASERLVPRCSNEDVAFPNHGMGEPAVSLHNGGLLHRAGRPPNLGLPKILTAQA